MNRVYEKIISVFYNNRVDRPGEPELRIFPKYVDPELLKVGNPYLRPHFTQTFELAYKNIWTTGSIYISGYHRIIDGHFLRIYALDSARQDYEIINKIYQNVGNATNSGVEILVTQDISFFLTKGHITFQDPRKTPGTSRLTTKLICQINFNSN